jgi:hypothetical protein
MSSLEQIADAKIYAAAQRLIGELDREVEAIKRANAAKGILQSGRTMKQIARACEAAFEKLGEAAKTEWGWVVQESFWLKPSGRDRLMSDVKLHLQEILGASEDHLEKITALIGTPELYERLQSDLVTVHDRTLTDLSLFIDGQSLVKKNRLLRRIVTNLLGWIPKLFGVSK